MRPLLIIHPNRLSLNIELLKPLQTNEEVIEGAEITETKQI